MACIIKPHYGDHKGVISFTTPEYKKIRSSRIIQEMINKLKEKYFIGLHFNWHNYSFKPIQMFDFYMAGDEDLGEVGRGEYNLINMDACNFTPTCYKKSNTEKFWDILVVGNPVFFKRPEVVLKTIRELYDQGRMYKVLYICPMQEYDKKNASSVFYDIRRYYEHLFSKNEQESFTLLTTTFNSPFPFNRETLSVFFKNSKVFLHCADNERRCRIAAYAWCAGLPVVARESVASILPKKLQTTPGFYLVNDQDNYADQIIDAVDNFARFNPEEYANELSVDKTVNCLESKLKDMFNKNNEHYVGDILSQNLDIRLGRHHGDISVDANNCAGSIELFIDKCLSVGAGEIGNMKKSAYPEDELVNLNVGKSRIEKFRSVYLSKEANVIDKAKFVVKKILLKESS